MISIIVPCYNQALYLPETLDSVLAQTYQDWECIIVNDGSPDNTEEVAKKYCEKDIRIKYVCKKNGGLADARNFGIITSVGEYILPLDSDDKIAPTYLEKAIRHFEQYPETSLVYCKADRFDGKNEPWDLPEYSYDSLKWGNCIFCSAVYKRTDYDKTNGYNVNMRFGYEDWDFWLSLLSPHSVVYRIEEVLFHYRYRENSMVNAVKEERYESMLRQICHNHVNLYSPYFDRVIIFHKLCKKEEKLEQDYNNLLNSKSFRIGNMVIKSFKCLLSIFK